MQNPACIVWCSEKFKTLYPDKYKALEKNKNKRFRTDFLYHSILSAGNIPTSLIDKHLDIFE